MYTYVITIRNRKLVNERLLVLSSLGGGPRVVVSTDAFHARVRGSFPGLGGLKETHKFLLHSHRETQYCGGASVTER